MSEPDIGLLFARDPLKLADADFARIIAKFRENRHLFNSGVKAPTGKAKTAKEKEVAEALGNTDLGISLDDI